MTLVKDRRAKIMIAALLAKIISWRPTRGEKPAMAPPQLSDNLQMEKEDKDEMVHLLSDNLHMVDKEDNNIERVRKGSVVSVCEVFAHQMEKENNSGLIKKGDQKDLKLETDMIFLSVYFKI